MTATRPVSGKRFVPLFLAAVLVLVGLTIAFRRAVPRPEGGVLQLVAVDDRRAIAIREGAGGRFPVLMLEEAGGRRAWTRTLTTTGGGVAPVVDLARDRLYIATRTHQSERIVEVLKLSSGEPIAQGGSPSASAPIAFGLAPVIRGDRVLTLYGPHAAQLVAFDARPNAPRETRQPLGSMVGAWRLEDGYLVVDEAGRAQSLGADGSTGELSARSVGEAGSSYCATGTEVLELKRDGRLVEPLTAKLVATLPAAKDSGAPAGSPTSASPAAAANANAPLLACARRERDWIVLRGTDHIERVVRVGPGGVAFDLALDAAKPAIALPDSLPPIALFVDRRESLIAVDLDRGQAQAMQGCGRTAAVLSTEQEHFVFAAGRLIRLNERGTQGVEVELGPTLLPRRTQLSSGVLWLHESVRVFPRDRRTLAGLDARPQPSACGRN